MNSLQKVIFLLVLILLSPSMDTVFFYEMIRYTTK